MGEISSVFRDATLVVDGALSEGDLLVTGDRIAAVGSVPSPPDAFEIDLGGRILAPGLIDLQINGLRGREVFEGTPDALLHIAKAAPSTGCTAILPTLISAPLERYGRVATSLRELEGGGERLSAARILGIHLEGPYLNPAFRGAHEAADLRTPDVREVEAILEEAGGAIRLWTLAPELPGADALVELLAERGVLVAAGHSALGYDEAMGWFDQGVDMVTHLFNAMTRFHHRDPGIALATLQHRSVVFTVIADGHHVVPSVIAMAAGLAGDRLLLVTDAVAAAGALDGRYRLGRREINSREGRVEVDGRIAGSTLGAVDAVRNLAAWANLPIAKCIDSMSALPAHLLGLPDLGALHEGAMADLIVLTEEGTLVQTWVGGRLVFQ